MMCCNATLPPGCSPRGEDHHRIHPGIGENIGLGGKPDAGQLPARQQLMPYLPRVGIDEDFIRQHESQRIPPAQPPEADMEEIQIEIGRAGERRGI